MPDKCPETGSGFQMGGPFWAEPIHDPQWVAGLLQQIRRDKDRCARAAGLRCLLRHKLVFMAARRRSSR